ncbi:MAG: hypothetical protein A2Y25_11860 [Candidatus Melainabacteria bacterium GWF2_37_15]|nr:MAG: hypothetical protein A2Y25_11860 [Candidatus Melainabacteria bacterium GWF2_37_15]
MNLIDKILNNEYLINNPPILLDIGASGFIHKKWVKIAKYSICIAFDADKRELEPTEKENKNFKKLYVFNKILTDSNEQEAIFYLTESPFCSSLLPPDNEKLQKWAFFDLFKIKETVKIPAVNLPSVLENLQINQIDWFKTDSQGTDLRLFKSLGDNVIEKVLAAEFEPGIIDAYKGEDKLYNLLTFMDKKPFWVSNLKICGAQRINREYLEKLSINKLYRTSLKKSPGWANVMFLNSFEKDNEFTKRDFLLGCVFGLLEKQYGYVIELSLKAYERYNDVIFREIEHYCAEKIIKANKKMELPYKIYSFIKNWRKRKNA